MIDTQPTGAPSPASGSHLRASPAGTAPPSAGTCFHCGLPLPAGADYRAVIDGEPRPMCCAGCQAVAQAIADAGLSDYYRHRSALPGSPREALPPFLESLKLYDAPEVQRSFVRSVEASVREASLILEGITCAACLWLNEQHLARLPGVLGVEINYSSYRVRVRWDETRIRLSDILQAVAEIGYTAHPFDPGRQEAAYRERRRSALWQLFVAGFGMMQVMMYAVPAYLAGDGEMSPDIQGLLRIASLVLTAPVVFYSAAPFFRGAWRDLKARRVGMDVPVALGVAIAFLASLWATLSGRGEVYFDSIAMFVFFLLAGRFLEMEARHRALDATEKLVKLIPASARLLAGYPGSREETRVPVTELKAGDYVLIKPGEAIPADGRVVEGETEADEALMTGESCPVAKRKGEALTGGAVNVTSPVVMGVEKVGEDTVLAGIVRLLDRAASEKPPIAVAADRVAGWFVAALLAVAALTAAYWYVADPGRALAVTVSVLVVTCPCALSLATPAALAAATGRLTGLGLLITRGHALEAFARATHFVFDKTGTLTFGRVDVVEALALGTLKASEALGLAAALEAGSEHAIARALIAAARQKGAEVPVAEALGAVPGSGVEGRIAGQRLRLGTPAYCAELAGEPVPEAILARLQRGRSVVALAFDGGWLACFVLADGIRPDARALVQALKALGREVHLLSGDAPEAARRVAQALGIETAVAGVSPAGKLEYLASLQRQGAVVVMVGDGVNDAPVLTRADVSIAMGKGTEVAQASADMILLSDQLSSLLEGYRIVLKTRRVIHQNFAWAILYNLVALPLAVLGHVTPWMAGLGMAASSLLVVLNALRLAAPRTSAAGSRPSIPNPRPAVVN